MDIPVQADSLLQLPRRVRRSPDTVTRRIGTETIIVPIRSHVADLDAVYTLNEIGSRIWELIDTEGDIRGLIGTISSEYDVSANAAARDLIDFVLELESEGLLQFSESHNT